jgi:predicted ABC-type ATPase
MGSSGKPQRPFIFVLAGVNGAGKSSVGGSRVRDYGLEWFNPDAYARQLMQEHGRKLEQANAEAWEHGRSRLAAAIAEKKNFAFETTLGANTIARMLSEASRTHDVVMWFCGLSSPELHIARVAARVKRGGHAIPEKKIRERWDGSRLNVIQLLPHLAHLQVFDNSTEVAPGEPIPDPILVLEVVNGRLSFPDPNDAATLANTPRWAKQIVQAAIELDDDTRRDAAP